MAEGLEGEEWRYWFAYRALAVFVPLVMALLTLVESALIDIAAVHLCGWPATISCDSGMPLVWSALRWTLWAFTALCAIDVALFLRTPTFDAARRILWWGGWGPVTVILTLGAAQDRTIETADLVLGAGEMLIALVLAGRTLAARLEVPERWVAIALAPLILVAGTVPLWAPPAFEAVHDPPAPDEIWLGP